MTYDDIKKIVCEKVGLIDTVVLGSGSSISFGMPNMNELGDYLKSHFLHVEKTDNWAEISILLDRGVGIEEALNAAHPTENVIREIVHSIWGYIIDRSSILENSLLTSSFNTELSDFFTTLSKRSNFHLNIITTNYDKVIELSLDYAHLLFSNGYSGQTLVNFVGFDTAKFPINVFKVHGSIDWFQNSDGSIFGLNNIPKSLIPNISPVIVTPGTSKYIETHKRPYRDIMGKADDSINHCDVIFCAGYGFNDEHIHPLIVEKILKKHISGYVLMRRIGDNARRCVVNKMSDKSEVVVFEEGETTGSTNVFYKTEKIVVNKALWNIKGFCEEFL